MNTDQVAVLVREERLAATARLVREYRRFYNGERAPLPAGVKGDDDAA